MARIDFGFEDLIGLFCHPRHRRYEVILAAVKERDGPNDPRRAGRWDNGNMTEGGTPEVAVTDVPDDAVLLDVREGDEWAAGHAPGAVHIPMTTIADNLDEVPEGSPIYVVCRSGGRSARATAYLNASGWDAVNVAGGMSAWVAAARPLAADGGRAPEII